MATFAAACSLFSSSFEKKERDDGSSYYALQADSPEWMRSAVREAHDGELPNDSRYDLIRDALSSLSENLYDSADDAREDAAEIALQLQPTYTGELLQWFAEHPARLQDCDDAREERGTSQESIYDALSDGFARSAESTILSLIEEIEENRSSVFNPDTDCRLILSDSHGQYIPQMYCEGMIEDQAEEIGVNFSDVLVCQSGPDSEHYWEAWQSICDDALIIDAQGEEWRLLQNGDLWEIRADVELPKEWIAV